MATCAQISKIMPYNTPKLFLFVIQTNNQKSRNFFPKFKNTNFQTNLSLRNVDSFKFIASEWGTWKRTQVV